MKSFFLLAVAMGLTGCMGFEGNDAHNEIADCWAKAKSIEEMRACDVKMQEAEKAEGTAVQGSTVGVMAQRQFSGPMRNEPNQRNVTASRA